LEQADLILQNRNLSDDAVKLLRKMILNGMLKPGERVNQVHLATRMNISRGPLREALRMLQKEGLVIHENNRGTFVTTLSEEDAWEIYTMRALLESKAAEIAINYMTEQEFDRLRSILEDLKQSTLENDLEKMMQCDMEFHHTIVRASRHQRLLQSHEQLSVQLGAMFLTMSNKVPVRVQKAIENHEILIEALKSEDPERVKTAFSDHYMNALKDLLGEEYLRNK
jgi:DNA-binding GntR family transcriptional regulator